MSARRDSLTGRSCSVPEHGGVRSQSFKWLRSGGATGPRAGYAATRSAIQRSLDMRHWSESGRSAFTAPVDHDVVSPSKTAQNPDAGAKLPKSPIG